ncbi:UBP13 [Symbiodinium sp. CCMP2592]|nr:UBP13 [Symbiodinium sp. CCMP2592]
MDSPADGNAREMSPPSKRARLGPEEPERPGRLAELDLRSADLEGRDDAEEDDADEESASRDIDSRPNSFDSSVAGPERPPNGRAEVTENLFRKENLPPPMDHEIEFLIKDPKSFSVGQSVTSEMKTLHGCFTFRLLVFPMGTETTTPPNQVAAFVEAQAPPDCEDVRWAFEGVKYQIAVVNWKDYRKSTTQVDVWNFTRDHADRGWHKTFLKAKDMSSETGWLSENSELCLRACCSSRRAMVQTPGRRLANYVGLKNHGATCYMNCLLQTLFCLGHFRHIAYSIEVPETDQQAVVSSDDISDTLGFDDDRPALPLLVSLQNLFYRLQTSDHAGPQGAVSCRELMRSFGWDTADAFMQHDAQELNRLLCDRLEEQMKGTPTDGEIKRNVLGLLGDMSLLMRKRFMFDPEKMDMGKLNGKMEFPQVLDLEAFAPGSGKYMLHTVIVHSGGVSSGHYYAFVRVRDGDKSQWVKFDDDDLLDGPADVQLVLLPFCSSDLAETSRLVLAASAGQLSDLEEILQRPMDPNGISAKGSTALITASMEQTDVTVVSLLLEAGAEPNMADEVGLTALLAASTQGNLEVVRLLLKDGAKKDLADNDGMTAFLSASRRGHVDIVRLLIDAGADMNVADRNGWTALLWASFNGLAAIIRVLLDAGARVDVAGNNRDTALLWASSCGQLEVARMLVEAGIDKDASDLDGDTALLIAARNGHAEVVRFLLEADKLFS